VAFASSSSGSEGVQGDTPTRSQNASQRSTLSAMRCALAIRFSYGQGAALGAQFPAHGFAADTRLV